MNVTCEQCRYFCAGAESGEGECRRYAPHAVVPRDADDTYTGDFYTTWPVVRSDGWCGDFAVDHSNL